MSQDTIIICASGNTSTSQQDNIPSVAPEATQEEQAQEAAVVKSRNRTRSFDDNAIATKKEKFKSRSYTLDQLWKKNKHKKSEIDNKNQDSSTTENAAGNEVIQEDNEKSATSQLVQAGSLSPGDNINKEDIDNECTQLDLRSRLQNLAFIFSLPHLVMLSNLQKLIGIRTGKKPSIQPNDYMDNLLQNARATMKERGLNNVQLPDQNMGVALYNGKMTGLDNLARSGDALLEAESDHFLLSFAIEANDIKANYWWKKQRLR